MEHNETQDTLWLPDGYGAGTIIYDLEGNPHEAVSNVVSGTGIYSIKPVEKEYALSRIRNGASHLESSKN